VQGLPNIVLVHGAWTEGSSWSADRLAASLAAHGVAHAVHVFAHGPHSLGLAIGAGEPAVWTEIAKRWIQEQTGA
jgi:hypothetical protein